MAATTAEKALKNVQKQYIRNEKAGSSILPDSTTENQQDMKTNLATTITSAEIVPFPGNQTQPDANTRAPKAIATPLQQNCNIATIVATKPRRGDEKEVRFDWHGREYRIYRRTSKTWFFNLFKKGQPRVAKSLETDVKEVALAAAKKILEAGRQGKLAEMDAVIGRGVAKACATAGQLWDAFEDMILDVSPIHRKNCLSSMKHVLRTLGQGGDWRAVNTADLFTPDQTHHFFEVKTELAQACGDPEEECTIRRTANANMNRIRSLLTPKVLANYTRAGLVLPDVEPFLKSINAERYPARTLVSEYRPPDDALIRKTLHAWATLDFGSGLEHSPNETRRRGGTTTSERNMFLAGGLALCFGLRKGEIAKAKWGHLIETKHGPLFDGVMKTKGKKGAYITVAPLDPWYTVFMRRIEKEGWRGAADDYILSGCDTERTDWTFRHLSNWMRQLGWETQKTNHALRAYAGSMIAMKWTIWDASKWLRHSNVKVTQAHYTGFVTARKIRNREKILIRWAR